MVGEHFYAHLIAMFLNGLIILLLWSEFILETAPLAQSVECNRRHLYVSGSIPAKYDPNLTNVYMSQLVCSAYLCACSISVLLPYVF